MNDNEILWAYYLEQRTSARSFDDQRTSIANFVLTIAGILIGFSATLAFSWSSIIVYVFVALLGAYGVATTRKLYECSSFCMRRAADALGRLKGTYPYTLAEIKESALSEQRKQFRIISRVRLHLVWIILHVLILCFGVAGIGIAIVCNL